MNPNRRRLLGLALAALPAGTALAGAVPARDACRRTEDDILGPYYLRGAPQTTRLCGPDRPGEPLAVQGRVLGLPGCGPLGDALVEVWQADAQGRYTLTGHGEAPALEDCMLRARIVTGGDGRYGFETVLPGHYAVGRGQYRPRHIHFRVSRPGYATLVTQLYFRGDPHLAGDPFARDSLVVELKRGNDPAGRAMWTAAFDIVLEKG